MPADIYRDAPESVKEQKVTDAADFQSILDERNRIARSPFPEHEACYAYNYDPDIGIVDYAAARRDEKSPNGYQIYGLYGEKVPESWAEKHQAECSFIHDYDRNTDIYFRIFNKCRADQIRTVEKMTYDPVTKKFFCSDDLHNKVMEEGVIG